MQTDAIPTKRGNRGADHVIPEDHALCGVHHRSAARLLRIQGSPDPSAPCGTGQLSYWTKLLQ